MSQPSTPFDYDEIDREEGPERGLGDVLRGLVFALTDNNGRRIPPERLHRVAYQRLCCSVFCLSSDPDIVESMSPTCVAARVGVSKESSRRVMGTFARKMGLGSIYKARMYNNPSRSRSKRMEQHKMPIYMQTGSVGSKESFEIGRLNSGEVYPHRFSHCRQK